VAHGNRKAASRRMAESGKSPNQIGAVTGHRTLKGVERYTREAEVRVLQTMLLAPPNGQKRRTETAYPSGRDRKMRKKRDKSVA